MGEPYGSFKSLAPQRARVCNARLLINPPKIKQQAGFFTIVSIKKKSNMKKSVIFFLTFLIVSGCQADNDEIIETVEQESVQDFDPEPTFTPIVLTINNPTSEVFISANDYPLIRTALLEMYDSMFLPEERFAYFFKKLHKEDPEGLISSLAVKNQFLSTNSDDLRERYNLLNLLGNICGTNVLDFLHTIAVSPMPNGLTRDDENHEWQYMLRVIAARNIFRTYKFRNSSEAYGYILSILGSSSNILKDVRLELISHLRVFDSLSNSQLQTILNVDFHYLLNTETLLQAPYNVIPNDPVKQDPPVEEAPIMEGN